MQTQPKAETTTTPSPAGGLSDQSETGSADAKPDTGGSAFPVQASYPFGPSDGMSMRDWFAGMAMQGMLASDSFADEEAPELLHVAYNFADAALERRKR